MVTAALAAPINEGSGVKQGPLLMIDDTVAACESFINAEPAFTPPPVPAPIAAALSAALPPGPEDWLLPLPPSVGSGVTAFLPPFDRGCCTTQGGTGLAEVASGDHRGQFTVDLLADPGQYAYAVASPCLTFTAPIDGYARCRMAVVVDGVVALGGSEPGEAMARLGSWIAHCHPKERGRYSERLAWETDHATGTVRFSQFVIHHEAVLPVVKDEEHLFGTGLSVAVAARSGTAGVRLHGRLAYLTVAFTDTP